MSLADRTPPSAAEYESYRERFSNWGRWGDLDELGTLNHITPEARREAASGTVDIPTASAPIVRNIRISAGVSYEGPASDA